jgi:hypothetical protein
MHFRAVLLLTLSLAVASMWAQQPAAGIEFNGVLVTGGKTTVSLFNPATGEAGWVAVGRKFGGRTVTAYHAADAKADRSADTVVLTRDSDGRSETITLKGAPIVTTPTVPASSSPSGLVFNLPLGARLTGPIDPSRPTEIGQVFISEEPVPNSPEGKIQLTAVSLAGYSKIEDGGTDSIYQPIYSVREIIGTPERVAAEKTKELDRVAKLKEAASSQTTATATSPQPATPPAKTP